MSSISTIAYTRRRIAKPAAADSLYCTQLRTRNCDGSVWRNVLAT